MADEMNLAQLYLDIADVIIVAIASDETVIEINKKGCEILGYKKGEILGQNWFDKFIPARMRDEVRPLFHKMLAGTLRLSHYENPVLTQDGSERLIAWHNILLRDDQDHVIATLSSGEDITDRKALERELNDYRQRLEQVVAERTADFARANEKLVREAEEHKKAQEGLTLRATILDNAREAVFLLNPNGDFVYANEAAVKTYGYTRKEFLSLDLRKLLPPHLAPLIGPRLKEVVRKHQLELETIHVRKDKSLMPVQVRHSLITMPRGQFIVSVIRDITSEVRLRQLLAAMPAMLWATDTELKLTSASGAGLTAAGLEPPKTGLSLGEYLEKNRLPDSILNAHRRALTGESVAYQFKKGEQAYFGRAAPLRDAQGELIGTINVALDVKDFQKTPK